MCCAFLRPARRFRFGRAVFLLALTLTTCTPAARTPPRPLTPPQSLAPPPQSEQTIERSVAGLPQNADQAPAPKPIIVRGTTPTSASAAPAPPDNEPADITLNFAGADIRDVIQSVLGGTLKLNYVVDPDVTGPVTFSASRPLRRSEVLDVLQAVLESRGFTLVQNDGVMRVMARPGAQRPRVAAPIGAGTGIGERVEVIPLRFVSPTDLAGVLAKVLPQDAPVIPDERRKLLLVGGTTDELRLAADTARIFDVDALAGTSVAILPLQNADADTVVLELQSIFNASRRDTIADVVRVLPIERLNVVMVLTREPRYLDEARAWVQRLDQSRATNEQRVFVYYLQYGKAGPVAQTLQGALSGMDVEVKGTDTANASQGLAAAQVGSQATEVPPTAPGFPAPPSLIASLNAPAQAQPNTPAKPDDQTKPSVRIEADDAHNALIISATPRDYGLIRQVLQEIDTPPLQVLIEVTVAEVTLNDNLQYGVQYFLNSHGNASGNVSALLTTGTTPLGITPTTPGFSLAFTGSNIAPRVVLDALSNLTQTKVISTPRLMVLDNQTARLQVGDVVPIITQSATSTATSTPLVLSNVQYKETGVVLEVTPRVNASGYVTLDINQSVSDVETTTTSTINSPTFTQRRLTSTISVKSGNSVLLGGLIQDQDNRNSQGIPLLQDVPVLGWLFGNKNDTAARTELIMFMTPYVLSTDQETRDITDTVRREFDSALDRSSLVAPRPVPR